MTPLPPLLPTCPLHPWPVHLTGVFTGPGSNCSVDPARVVVPDVGAAVEAALHRSRSSLWHSMR